MKGVQTEEIKLEIKEWQSNPAVQPRERDTTYSTCEDEEDAMVEGEVIPVLPLEKAISEEEERNSRIFCNRVIVCMLVVSMLWLTSLQVAIGIVDSYISTPTMTAVIKGCDYSYNVVSEERTAFGKCVTNQLIDCNTELTTSYIDEKAKVANYESLNAATLLALQRR